MKTAKPKPESLNKPVSFTISLSDGQGARVVIHDDFSDHLERIVFVRIGGGLAPVFVNGDTALVCIRRNASKVYVYVRSTKIEVAISGPGTVRRFRGHSYCKPPDKFNRKTGRRFALKHLFESMKDAKGKWLVKGEDRRRIAEAVLFGRPKEEGKHGVGK